MSTRDPLAHSTPSRCPPHAQDAPGRSAPPAAPPRPPRPNRPHGKEGRMAQLADALTAAFTGTTIAPRAADYDQARSVWNGAIDRRPALIARCATAEQVAQAVRFGTSQ